MTEGTKTDIVVGGLILVLVVGSFLMWWLT